MSYYLHPEHATQRLREEWNKYGSLIIAVDYDSTLIPFHIHEENSDFERIRQLIRDCYAMGCTIIINTGSELARWEGIMDELKELNIPWHLFNESPAYLGEIGKNGKVYANAYIDDRAGLWQVVRDLELLVQERKHASAYKAAESANNYISKL